METIDFSAVGHLFSTSRKVFITSHSNPDGDAIGSALALYHFMLAAGHEAHVMVPNAFPDFLAWLSGHEQILIYEQARERCDALIREADILFALDYNSPSRIGEVSGPFMKAGGIKILIDHHIDPETEVYDHCFSTTEVSSTSELVYRFMEDTDSLLIDKDMAEAIYVGIMTDTGSFSYNCNYESTFAIVARLIRHGIDTNRISRLVYSNNTESRLRLLGYALSSKLTVLPEYRTAFIALTREELARFSHRTGDTEGLVNYALSIKGIRFAALFTEREDKIRISFRSTGDFSVNDFARRHFLGGGHRNAAGGDSFAPMDQTLEEFIRLLKEYRNTLS